MYVGLKQPRGDGERYVTPARAAAKETKAHHMRPPCLFTKNKSRDSFRREISPQCMLS